MGVGSVRVMFSDFSADSFGGLASALGDKIGFHVWGLQSRSP